MCLVGAAPVAAQTTQAHDAAQHRLQNLLAKQPPETQIGLVVAAAETGEVWFAHLPDTPLKPASVQKLFVTAAALERFGPDFQYQTRVYLRGSELWVIGAGDPALGDERIADRHNRSRDHLFDEWAAALRARNVTSLSGIILDDTIFEPPSRHPDWPNDQADRWYQAPVGGLNLNDNCLDVNIVVRGGKIELRFQPDIPAGLVDNKLKIGKTQHPIIKRHINSDVFQLRGTVTHSAPLKAVSVRQPTVFFGLALKRALEQRGIKVTGDIVQQHLNAEAIPLTALLATHTTSMSDVIWRCNKFSQNLFAECLLKSLAAYEPDGHRSGNAGSWDAGRGVLYETLGKLELDPRTATIRDGSGLSHSNRATASQIVQVLLKMRRHRHADVFLASLAEPGRPGSMQHRNNDPLLSGRLRGKTGTIAGVRTLAGYLTRPGGEVLAFALLINGQADRTLPRQVCKILLETNLNDRARS